MGCRKLAILTEKTNVKTTTKTREKASISKRYITLQFAGQAGMTVLVAGSFEDNTTGSFVGFVLVNLLSAAITIPSGT